MTAFLSILRRALFIGATFTSVGALLHANAGNSVDAVLYALLCALCVLGLLVKTADKRPAA